ncbi:hypothetical protein SAMN05660462_02477 [Proteiniborus ethanoligenes]|uniref:Uncharacterized protein n=1 Tax=Proteiniborus ethanoligenes TaxID=415015 RepID=A0A1H3RNC5_9FIRM|nr:hypothetical protein [Proteiniborus ethanoligenes]SDZ27222.1 hypothetical protein SAMN05660462_02477 [Proteiniborus ethanoligenes]
MNNNILLNNGKNFLKAGLTLVIYNTSRDMLNQISRNTIETLVRDIRKVRSEIKDRKAINAN